MPLEFFDAPAVQTIGPGAMKGKIRAAGPPDGRACRPLGRRTSGRFLTYPVLSGDFSARFVIHDLKHPDDTFSPLWHGSILRPGPHRGVHDFPAEDGPACEQVKRIAACNENCRFQLYLSNRQPHGPRRRIPCQSTPSCLPLPRWFCS